MDRTSFLQSLTTMTLDQINQFIKENGKKKEPESYDCPWTIDITKVDPVFNSKEGDNDCH